MNFLLRTIGLIGLVANGYLQADPLPVGPVQDSSSHITKVTELYQPNHKLASELVQTLGPIYQQEATLTAEGQHIIIRGENAVVNQVQELLLQLDHPARVFHIEISSSPTPPNSTTYSTQSRRLSQKTFSITENTPLVLIKEQLSQQLDSLGPLSSHVHWSSVNLVPTNQEALELNLQAAKDTVYVDFKLQTLANGHYRSSSYRLSGPINQWLAVVPAQQHGDQHHWSTRRDSAENVFIKVTPLD